MANRTGDDETQLIDFQMGELSAGEQEEVRRRLSSEEPFKRLHDDIANTFAAMQLAPESDPPEHLTEATLDHIRGARRTDELLATEESRPAAIRPTFSLRELTVIAAALILMAAIIVPSVRAARYQAVIRNCASNVGQIGSALMTYANANDDYLPAVDAQQKRWLPAAEEPSLSNSSALYKLVRSEDASPVIFQCPGGQRRSFVVEGNMTDFPGGKFIGYSYQHTLGPRKMRLNDPVLAGAAEKMAILADSNPLFADGRFCPDKLNRMVSDNHGGTGQNVLYFDMHVMWFKRPNVGVQGNNIFLVDGVFDYRGVEEPCGPTDTFLLPAFSPPACPVGRSPQGGR